MQESIALLQDYAARDPRLRVHQNATNLGFTQNFERAISLSRGDFIALCDQDDYWHPRKLSALLAYIGDAALVYCDSALMDENGNDLGLKVSDRLNMYRGNDPRPFIFRNCVSGHALLCRRQLVAQALPIPPYTFHDWWLALVAAATGGIEYVDACLVSYRQHMGASTDMFDLRGARPRRGHGLGINMIEQRRTLLSRMVALSKNSQRQFFVDFLALWQGWYSAYFSLRLAHFIYLHRKSLLEISKGDALIKLAKPLQFLPGLRLLRLLRLEQYTPPT